MIEKIHFEFTERLVNLNWKLKLESNRVPVPADYSQSEIEEAILKYKLSLVYPSFRRRNLSFNVTMRDFITDCINQVESDMKAIVTGIKFFSLEDVMKIYFGNLIFTGDWITTVDPNLANIMVDELFNMYGLNKSQLVNSDQGTLSLFINIPHTTIKLMNLYELNLTSLNKLYSKDLMTSLIFKSNDIKF